MLPVPLREPSEAGFQGFLLQHARGRAGGVEVQHLPGTHGQDVHAVEHDQVPSFPIRQRRAKSGVVVVVFVVVVVVVLFSSGLGSHRKVQITPSNSVFVLAHEAPFPIPDNKTHKSRQTRTLKACSCN